MTDLYFVDTSVLVYSRDGSEPDKQPVAGARLRYLWQSRGAAQSVQVLQGFYQVVTRRLSPGIIVFLAREDVRDLLAWQPAAVDAAVIEKAWEVEDRFGLSWWALRPRLLARRVAPTAAANPPKGSPTGFR